MDADRTFVFNPRPSASIRGLNFFTPSYGRVFAANPKSANHTSPGSGFIEQIQNFLFNGAGPQQIKNVAVGEVDDLRDAFAHLSSRLRLPLAQPSVQLLYQRVHNNLFFECNAPH
jgi:hypothetical protein